MNDYLIKATAADGLIRAFAITAKDMVNTASALHHTSPVASAALGRLLCASVMMGADLKGEQDRITLQIRGDGPLQGLIATADSSCHGKGYVFQPDAEVPLLSTGKLDVKKAIGAGRMSVSKDIGLKEPYVGVIHLVSGEIAEDIAYYFAQSEQIPSSVSLGVLVDRDYSIKQAGGFILQLMPDAPLDMITQLETRLETLPHISDLLEQENTPEDILNQILEGLHPVITYHSDVSFQCNCSKARVEEVLSSLGKEEMQNIITEDGQADLHCQFCNKQYFFQKEELEALLQQLQAQSS